MALYLCIKPRTAPNVVQGSRIRKRRLRMTFEALAERSYTAGQPMVGDELGAWIESRVASLTIGETLFPHGIPLEATGNRQPSWVVTMEALPGQGPQWYVGGGGPEYERVGMRITGHAVKDGKPWESAIAAVGAVYDLFIATWNTEIPAS